MDNYHYGIIGNCSTAALISKDCSVDWLCLPYFDSSSFFGRLIDEEKGGFFKISGVNTKHVHQSYIHNTAILKTVIETDDGVFEVNDYMPRFFLPSAKYYCPSEIHRNIRVVSGRPKIVVELDARPNYALSEADYTIKDTYLKITTRQGHYNSAYLYSNLFYQDIIDSEPIELTENSFFLLSFHEKLEDINNAKIFLEYEKTKTYWMDWAHRTHSPKESKDMFLRSALTLKLLMFQRTGAVLAAATTSLPEIIGRDRNWDYRYCWVRDAAMIIDTYVRIGHMESADGFIKFILNRMMLKHEDIGVMYGINGEEDLTEEILDHLAGYKNSKPVRIGNAAYSQKQNDLYGELIETIYTYFFINHDSKHHLNEEVWTMVRSLVNRVRDCWREKDSGIWERREAMQHYVHSKLMSWVAFDRAVKIAKVLNKQSHAQAWAREAEEVKIDILKNGWNEKLNCFTMYYGSEIYDASNLLMLHYGFLDHKDPRMISTVHEYYKHLAGTGFTFRYTAEDEFGTPENAFIVCSFWMINSLYLVGEKDKARAMFENLKSCANHLGLFAEDVEIATRRLTGNFPQGYSHLAFIQTVLLLETDYNWSDAFALKPKKAYR